MSKDFCGVIDLEASHHGWSQWCSSFQTTLVCRIKAME